MHADVSSFTFCFSSFSQFFTGFVFKLEQQIYMAEQIDFSEVTFEDNQAIIDLLEKRPMGVFSLLDEACLFPRSTDKSFLQKCCQTHKRNPNFAKGTFRYTYLASTNNLPLC